MNDILVNQEKTTDLSKGNPITEKSPNPPSNIDTPWIEAKAKNNIQNDARQDFCINLTNRFAVLQDKQKQPTKVVPGNLQYSDTVKKDTSQPQKYNSWCQSPPPSTQQPISLQPNINVAPQQTNQVQNQPLPCQLLQTHQSDQHPMIQPQYPQPMIQQPPIIPNFNPATQQPLLNHSRNISSQQTFQIRDQQSTDSTANQYQNFTNPNHSIINQPQRQNQQTAIDSQQPSLPRYSQQSTVQHIIPTSHGQPGIQFQNPANPNVQQPIMQQPRNHSISSRQPQIRNSNPQNQSIQHPSNTEQTNYYNSSQNARNNTNNSHNQQTPTKKGKIGMIGDSNFNKVLHREMSECVGREISKFSYSGATSAHLLCYSEVLLAEKPESVVILAGTNDIWGSNQRNEPSTVIANDILRLGEKFQQTGTKDILIVSIPDTRIRECNAKASEINRMVKEECKRKNFKYVDITDLGKHLDGPVHLSWEGRKIMVDRFINILK